MTRRPKDTEDKRLRRNAEDRRRYAELSQEKKDAMLLRRRQRYAEKKNIAQVVKTSNPRVPSHEILPSNNCQRIVISHTAELLQNKDSYRQEMTENNKNTLYANNELLKSIGDDAGASCLLGLSQTQKTTTTQKRGGKHDKRKEILMGGNMHVTKTVRVFEPTRQNSYMINKGIVFRDVGDNDLTGPRPRELPLNNASDKGKDQISYYTTFDLGSTSSCRNMATLSARNFLALTNDFPFPRMRQVKHITQLTSLEPEVMQQPRDAPETNENAGEATPSELKKRSRPVKVLAAARKTERNVSCREYYCYRLQIRPGDKSILLRAGRLLQQYVVDMYVKIETSRLNYFRLNQNEIRGDDYKRIVDSVAAGETDASKVVTDGQDVVDEIERFQSARWISSVEAIWRIYRFTLNEMRPSVQSLPLHLEGMFVIVVITRHTVIKANGSIISYKGKFTTVTGDRRNGRNFSANL